MSVCACARACSNSCCRAASVAPKRVQAVVVLVLFFGLLVNILLFYLFVCSCCCFWPFSLNLFVCLLQLYARKFTIVVVAVDVAFSLQSFLFFFNEFYIYTKHYLIIIMEKTNNKEHTFCGAQK